MNENEQANVSATGAAPPVAAPMMLACALGFLLGSTWGSLPFEGFGRTWALPYTFVACVATSVFLAAFPASRNAASSHPVALPAALLSLHAVCVAGSFGFSESSESLALGVASSLFEGIALALTAWECLKPLTRLPARQAGAGVCTAFLVAHAFYFVSLQFEHTTTFIAAQWIAGETIGVLLMAYASRKSAVNTSAQDDVQQALASPSRSNDVAPFFAVAAILMLVQGFFSAAAGFGVDFAFSGPSSSILVLGIRLLMLLLCAAGFLTGLSPTVQLAFFSLFWAGSLAFADLSIAGAGPAAGIYCLALGQYVLMAMVVIVGVCHLRCRTHADSSVNIAFAVAMLNQPTRLIGLSLAESVGFQTLHLACATASFTVCATAIAGLCVTLHLQSQSAQAAVFSQAKMDAASGSFGARLLHREQEHFTQFTELCSTYQLTEREQEILLEALHGRTVAGIGRQFALSQETVKTYLKRAYARAGCSNKQDLIAVMEAPSNKPTGPLDDSGEL